MCSLEAFNTGGEKRAEQQSRKASSVLCLEGFEFILGFLKFAAFSETQRRRERKGKASVVKC